MDAKQIGDFGLMAFAVPLFLLSLLWLVVTKWYSTAMGWIISGFFFCTTIFMGMVFYRVLIGNIPGVDLVRAILYNFLAIVFWAMVIGFIKIQLFPGYDQHKSDKEEPNGKETPRVPDA